MVSCFFAAAACPREQAGDTAAVLECGSACWWLSFPSYSLSVCFPIGFLQALASGAILSCSGKKVCKEAGLRGEQLACTRFGLWVLGVYLSHAVD